MKRFLMVVALACALSGTALAGDVPSTDKATPAPQASSSVVTTVILTIVNLVIR